MGLNVPWLGKSTDYTNVTGDFSGGAVVLGFNYFAGEHIKLFYSMKIFISEGCDSYDIYVLLLGHEVCVCVCVCVCAYLFKQLHPREREPREENGRRDV